MSGQNGARSWVRRPERAGNRGKLRPAHLRHPGAIAAAGVAGLASMALLAAGTGTSQAATLGATLSSRLLSVSDLPAGWSPAPTATTSVPEASSMPATSSSCIPKQRGLGLVSEAFVEGTSVPALGEALGSGAKARASWQQLRAAMANCRSATFTYDGKRVSATVQPLSLPSPALAGSSADQWSFSLDGVSVGVDLVLFRAAGYYGYLSYSDLGLPLVPTVAAFARAAAAKVTRGSTAPVPGSVSIASAPVESVYTALGSVAYRSVGSGPPLLMVNGWSATMEDWDPLLVDDLALHYRVVTFDNSGIGGTESLTAPLSIDAMADQTAALIDALHLGRPNVLGWSMGTGIVQALAVLHPGEVRSIVLCAPYPGNGAAVLPPKVVLDATNDPTALFPADQKGAEATYDAAISSYPEAPPAPQTTDAAQLSALYQWWAGDDPAGKLVAKITVPTLLADGDDDRLDPAANIHLLAVLIKGATVDLYPDAGHAFLYQDYSSFASSVESFLEGGRRNDAGKL